MFNRDREELEKERFLQEEVKESCKTAGFDILDHFPEVRKTIRSKRNNR